jgi:hypothetical protein
MYCSGTAGLCQESEFPGQACEKSSLEHLSSVDKCPIQQKPFYYPGNRSFHRMTHFDRYGANVHQGGFPEI